MYTHQAPDFDPEHKPVSNTEHEPFYKNTNFWWIVLAVLIVIIFIQHNPFKSKKHPTQAVSVVLSVARTADVPVYISGLGGVTPVITVTVKTQINGQLWRVLFKEGQMVKKGDLLAEIDPRIYQAQLTQYEGQLARDQALLANARIDLARYQKLWQQNSIAKQTLDTQVSLVNQYLGSVQTDQGLIAGVKVNLIYTEITSPVDGRVGLKLVDEGNVVQTSDTNGIAVIDTLNPIQVVFSIPEDSIPDVINQMNSNTPMTVKAYDRQQKTLLAVGTMLAMDNQVDPTTGMVKMKAQFDNKNNMLFPNQFVNVQLLVKTLSQATIVPTSAIQNGVKNNFVYVLNKDNTVTMKPVVTSVVSGNDTVVTSGVSPGDSVVTEGADKLTDGATVTTNDPTQKILDHDSGKKNRRKTA